ncbi:hypothetical protein OESDEN_05745 [Oesophagostomum dentatum]|uniref:Uncharacterized protein n=1 Tax=Oesophagostomum dentatum TaxID=61180 RepID=A0A0B1TAN3_OESDE|nr:hypothetical protein OESDEN_05745 [Oesophagostomum dentatum]
MFVAVLYRTGESTEPNANKPMDQMEMIRRLLMLVGSSTGGSQAAALQLLLSSGNPALTLATTQLLSEQARIAALTSIPSSCATDATQSDPQNVFATLLGNSLRTDSVAPQETTKMEVPSTATSRSGASSNRTASDAHTVLSSFVSKLLADSTNSEAKNGTTHAKTSSSAIMSPLLGTSASLPNATKLSFVSASESTNGVISQPENGNDSTPENRGSTRGTKGSEAVKRLGKGQAEALLNPLSLTSRPVNQWSTSEMDAVLNSPLFRTLPRMSFRPPTKRKLFDDFSVGFS